jgi:hypothetical protein
MTAIIDITPFFIADFCTKEQLERYCLLGYKLGVKRYIINFSNIEKIPCDFISMFAVKAENKAEIEKSFSKKLKVYADVKYADADISEKAAFFSSEIIYESRAHSIVYEGFDDLLSKQYDLTFQNMTKNVLKTDFFPKNKYNCACALAVEWTLAGGKYLGASFNGAGGYCPLEQISAALKVLGGEDFELEVLPEIKKLFETVTGAKQKFNAPVTGDNIFDVESGIHVDGILKNPFLYQPFDPAICGRRWSIALGKTSGKSAILYFAKKLGVKISQEKAQKMLLQIRSDAQNGIKTDVFYFKNLIESVK